MIFGLIGGLIAGAIGLAGTTATVVGGIIGAGLAFGARTLLGSYLNRKKARPYGAVQGDIQIGGNIPAQAIFGEAKTKGHRLYYAKYAPGDEINSEVLVLSNGWCDGLEPYVYFYGKKFDLVELPKIGNEVAHYGIPDYWYDNNPNGENCFSIRFYDGRPGQLVDQRLVDETANLDTPWKATSTVAGHAYVVVRKRFDGDHDFAENGNPEMEFVLRGLREYDPRKDSTVAGGSGTHRVDDPATHEWTENPALHRLNYQLGLRGLISNRTIIGEGKTLGQLDLGTYFAAMNVCDTLRNGKPTYACSLVVNADDDHTEVLKEFDDAMAGYGLNRRGLSGVIAGAPQLPVLEITRDDIPADRAKELRYRKSAFELYNHMSGQFTSIEDQWHPVSLDPIHVNADVAADGRVRQTSNDFLQVTDPDIAQYLLTIRYRQQRLGGKVTLPVSRRVGLTISEGEWVEFEGKEWLVQRWSVDEDFRFTLTLAETSANVYASEGIQPGPIVVPSTPPINPDNLPNVQNFNVEVGTVTGADGSQVPALRFTWTPPGDLTIDTVRFQYGPGTAAPAKPFSDVCPDPEAGEYVTTKNVSSLQRYTARATITTTPDRFKTWSQWKTTAQATSAFDIYAEINLDDLGQDVQDKFDGIDQTLTTEVADRIATVAANARAIRVRQEEVVELASLVMEARADDYGKRQEIRRGFVLDLGNARASFDERIVGLVAEDQALALRITDISASLDQSNAQILEVEEASVSRDDALAADLQQVSAAIGELESEGFDSLNTKVNRLADGQESQAQSLRGVRGSLEVSFEQQMEAAAVAYDGKKTALKASAGAYSQLDQSIRQVGERVDLNASAITAVQTTLGGKADAAALSSLSSTVTAQGEDIEANSEALTAVTAEVGDATAGGYLKMTGSAGPAGVLAEVDIAVRAAIGGTVGRAAISLQAYDDGGVIKTRALHVADEFIVTDGSTQALPFLFQAGVAYLDQVRVDWALIDNAQIAWADIDNAVINNLVVGTSNIGFAAVTSQVTLVVTPAAYPGSTDWVTIDTLDIEKAEGVFINARGTGTIADVNVGSFLVRLLRSDGIVVFQESVQASQGGSEVSIDVSDMLIDSNIPTGGYSYYAQARTNTSQGASGGFDVEFRILYWKR